MNVFRNPHHKVYNLNTNKILKYYLHVRANYKFYILELGQTSEIHLKLWKY